MYGTGIFMVLTGLRLGLMGIRRDPPEGQLQVMRQGQAFVLVRGLPCGVLWSLHVSCENLSAL